MAVNISYTDALAQQPKALHAMAGRIREQLPALGELLGSRRPVLVGIGASLAATAVAVHELRRRGIEAFRVTPGELPETAPVPGDVLLAVSQSGRSAETVGLVQHWSTAATSALVNIPATPLTECVGTAIDLGGHADSRASTLGFTGTVLGLGMLAGAWRGGAVDEGWDRLGELVSELEPRMVEAGRALAADVAAVSSVDVVGRAASLAAAEEGSLLVREGARLASTAWDTRNYLHGPMESAGGTAHILLGEEREAAAAVTLAKAGHLAVLVTTAGGEDVEAAAAAGARVVAVPDLPDAQRVVAETLFFQHLVGAVADLRGADMDEFLFNPGDTKLRDAAEERGRA